MGTSGWRGRKNYRKCRYIWPYSGIRIAGEGHQRRQAQGPPPIDQQAKVNQIGCKPEQGPGVQQEHPEAGGEESLESIARVVAQEGVEIVAAADIAVDVPDEARAAEEDDP